LTPDPEQVADVLRRLALGELSESDPEAEEVLEASAEARAEWRELSRVLRRLERAKQGEEEEGVIPITMADITEEDRAQVRRFFAPRLRDLRPAQPAFDWRRLLRLWAPVGVAACGLVLWILFPVRSGVAPDGAPADLLGTSGELGLSTAVEPLADGRWRLSWEHAADKPRIPGTVYRLELLGDGERVLSAFEDLAEPTWTGELEERGAAGGRITWRVRAVIEGEDYAAGRGVVVLPE